MFTPSKTRFRTASEALRFCFRVRELLHAGRAGRLLPDELPVDAPLAANAVGEFERIAWCMRGLDEVDLWLLCELYGPSSFGVRRRTFAHACEAGRAEFPELELRLRQVATLHRHALGLVEKNLRLLRMIPRASGSAGRKGRVRAQSHDKRATFHGAEASHR